MSLFGHRVFIGGKKIKKEVIRVGPNPVQQVSCRHRKLSTDMHSGGMLCEDEGNDWGDASISVGHQR